MIVHFSVWGSGADALEIPAYARKRDGEEAITAVTRALCRKNGLSTHGGPDLDGCDEAARPLYKVCLVSRPRGRPSSNRAYNVEAQLHVRLESTRGVTTTHIQPWGHGETFALDADTTDLVRRLSDAWAARTGRDWPMAEVVRCALVTHTPLLELAEIDANEQHARLAKVLAKLLKKEEKREKQKTAQK